MKRLTFLASLLLLGALSTSAQERQPSWLVRTGETPQDAPYENRPNFTPAVRGAFEDFTVKAKLNLHF